VTYGFDESADWHIERAEPSASGTRAWVKHEGEAFELRLQVAGRHMVANAVAALAVAQLSGEGTKMAIDALAAFGAAEGRGQTMRLGPAGKPLLLIDESYNANPASMAATLEVYAAAKAPEGRRILVLGDMLELGAQAPALHAALKEKILEAKPDKIFLVGPAMEALAS